MTESLGWWNPPVPVRGERVGITRNVSNAVEALRIMNGWDAKKSRKAVEV